MPTAAEDRGREVVGVCGGASSRRAATRTTDVRPAQVATVGGEDAARNRVRPPAGVAADSMGAGGTADVHELSNRGA